MTRRLANNRSPRWAFMERFEIPDYDEPERNYLTRWRLVQTPWFGVYLHRMDGPDPRPTLHDHPWDFVSVILRGGYSEVATDPHDPFHEGEPPSSGERREWPAPSVHRMRATDAHYITHLHRRPTWTLLLVGRRRREWGYWDEDGWTRFDRHRHAYEFDAAMAARKAAA